jgi:tetratricopeptide (TPR) repeat protein
MSDLITQLCQLTAETLRANPQGDLAELVELVKKSIDADSQLGEAIQSDRQLTQVNQDGSKGFQTWVAGGVANIGNTYLNDVQPEMLQEILQRVLADVFKSQLQSQVKQTALENVSAGGDINATITQKINHAPNKLAENIGVLAQAGSTVSIGTFIANNRLNEDRSEKVFHDKSFYNNLGDREIDRAGNFVGRDKDLEELHNLLQAQSESSTLPMVLISGMAGMGKSELARQYGKLYLDEYAGGVGIFEAAQFGESLRDFMQLRFCEDGDLRHFTKLETQVEEGWQQWQKFCGEEKLALILIDDVTEYKTQVLPYLPKSLGDVHPFRLVLTSRSLLQGKLAVLEIRELQTEAALQLLTKWAEPNQQTLLDNPVIATSLCNRLGCLPLALTLVGSWLKNSQATLPIAIAELEKNGLESEVLEPYTEAPEDVDPDKNIKQGLKAVLMVIWQQLSPDAQQLGRVLSLFEPINLPWELVVSVVQAYPNQSEAPTVRKSWWQRFRDSLGLLLRKLLPFLAKPVMQTKSAFVTIRNLKKAEIELRTKNLLQSVEDDETYRLHRLTHEFLGRQWEDADREGWVNAWVRGLSDRAQEIPASADWEQVTTWQPLRPHLESAKKIAEHLRHTAKSPAAIAAYKSQANNLMAGCFRLNQAPIFEATYRQAISKHDSAKAALAKEQNALAQNYFDEAIKGYQRAIEQARIALSENSPILAGYLYRISTLFDELGNYSAGIPPAEEAVKIFKTKAKSRTLALYFNNLAELYRSQGRYEEAEPLYKQALTLYQKLLGDRHPDVAIIINNLAVLYKSQGRYEEAEPLYKQALALKQELLGDRHLSVATSINNLAVLYDSQGRYEEAEPLYKQALSLIQELLGARHPDVATSINNLAFLYSSQGRYEEAEPLLKQALALRQELLGDRHPNVAISLNNLAALYDSQGRYEEAEPLYLKALEIMEVSLGMEHPNTKTVRNSLQSLRNLQN